MSGAPAALYPGRIMHARLGAVPHRFSYAVLGVLVDLTQLGACQRMSRLFSIDRFNLLSLHQQDHGARRRPMRETEADRGEPQVGRPAQNPLAAAIVAMVERHGADASGAIRMLAFPRVLGGVFSPLTVYFVDTAGGTPSAIVYEVRNTFGGIHHYVCPIEPGSVTPASIRQSVRKGFYVSPFMDMQQRYDFRIQPPAETAAVRILQHGADGPSLAATFFGQRMAMTDRNIVRTLAATRMSSWKVLAAIHYEAARLSLKGARYHSAPKTANAAGNPGQGAAE